MFYNRMEVLKILDANSFETFVLPWQCSCICNDGKELHQLAMSGGKVSGLKTFPEEI